MIKYTKGWKYVLAEDVIIQTGIYPPKRIQHKDEFMLDTMGYLHIKKNYPWDGATGALDTKSAMTASLVHDCFCEMMRVGELDYDTYSPLVHELLAKLARERGMWKWRSWSWQRVVTLARGGHPSHPDPHPILTAP